MVLILITAFLFIFYAFVISFYNRSWKQQPEFVSRIPSGNTSFSIIIPARNEEANIGRLLASIKIQNYPRHLFEVIVVDDNSIDKTALIAKSFEGVHTISLQDDSINSYKKKAITTGIAAAKNEWILCTDADCIVPENWLQTYAALIAEKRPVFIAAPVVLVPGFEADSKRKHFDLLFIFQSLDFLTLQGITAASVFKNVHTMCNGANLAYKKDVFYEVGGFKGVDEIASGDDMLLMHKIWKQHPTKIEYLKSAGSIVQTLAAPNWQGFINQRIRWASKAPRYDDKRIFYVLLLVYLFNLSFLVLLIASFFQTQYFIALLLAWVGKTLAELPFMINVSRFFSKKNLLVYFFFMQPLHILYTITAGFLGSFGSYEWKGRKVK